MIQLKVLGALGLAFLLLPLLIILLFAVNSAPYIAFPPTGFTLKWFVELFQHASIVRSIKTSLIVGLGVGVLSTLLGTPAAIWLWRTQSRFRGLVNALILAPLLTPLIVLAVAIYAVYSSLHLIGSLGGLIAAQATIGLPMVVTAVSANLANVSGNLENAAAVLGSRPWQTLTRVTIPMASNGIITGFILAFGVSFDELLIAMYVGGIEAQTFPVKIWEQLRTFVSPEITAAAALLMGFSIVMLLCIALVGNLRKVQPGSRPGK